MIGIDTFAFLVLMVVLPLLPAFLLFKYLPAKARAKGPLYGLHINLEGAIAGYVIILLVLLFAFRFALPGNFRKWDVKGNIAFDDGGGIPGQASLRLIPGFTVNSDGTFYLTVYAPRQSQLPELQILEDRYITATKELKSERPESGEALLNLGAIILKHDPLSTARPTQQEALVPKN